MLCDENYADAAIEPYVFYAEDIGMVYVENIYNFTEVSIFLQCGSGVNLLAIMSVI